MKTLSNIRTYAFCILLSAFALSGCKTVDCCFPTVFDGSETSITFDGSGGTKPVMIVCTQSWSVLSKPSWITGITPVGGNGPIDITCARNDQPGTRYGTIVLMAYNGDKLTIRVTQGDDPLLDFMTDGTPRWEDGTGLVEYNKDKPYTYLAGKGGNLFGSGNYKAGRITEDDGSKFEIIDFGQASTPGVNNYSGLLYDENNAGGIVLESLKVVKTEGDKLWIVFTVFPGDPERKIVQ